MDVILAVVDIFPDYSCVVKLTLIIFKKHEAWVYAKQIRTPKKEKISVKYSPEEQIFNLV